MKFLYVILDPITANNRKGLSVVMDQVCGVAQLGNQADYIYAAADGLIFCGGDGEQITPLPEGKKYRAAFCKAVCNWVEKGQYDYVYMKGTSVTKSAAKIAACAKEKSFGAKVVFQADPYSTRAEMKQKLRDCQRGGEKAEAGKIRSLMRAHRRSLSEFKRYVDTIAVFGTLVEEVWSLPALTLETGVALNRVPVRKQMMPQGSPIRLVSIVDESDTDGLDRLLRGLVVYGTDPRKDSIGVSIVGSGEKVDALRELAKELKLTESQVTFCGELDAEQINELCLESTLGISALGFYRNNIIYASPRTPKKFCAIGLPFVYAYEDMLLGIDTPFALKLPNNDSPINCALLAEFVWRCRLNPRMPQMARKFAEKHYDWRVVMKKILEFTATGRREV